MKPNCFDLNPGFEKLYDTFKKWKSDKSVKEYIQDPDLVFGNLIKSEFKMPLEAVAFNKLITKGDIKGFQDRLNNIIAAAGRGDIATNWGKLLYTPEAFSRKDPFLSQQLNSYIHTSHAYKGTEHKLGQMLRKIDTNLLIEQKARGFHSNALENIGKRITFQTANKQAQRMDEQIRKTTIDVQNNVEGAEQNLRKLMRAEEKLRVGSELGVYTEFIGLIEIGLPKLINEKISKSKSAFEKAKKLYPSDPSKWGKVYDWNAKRIIDPKTRAIKTFLSEAELYQLRNAQGEKISGNVAKALHQYMELTDNLYNSLVHGIGSYVKGITLGRKKGESVEQIKELEKKILKKLTPNLEKGYFPHFSRELSMDFMDGMMGRMEDLALTSNNYITTNMSMSTAIKNLDGYISGHTSKRADQGPASQSYSLDFNAVMKQYSDNVNRFNYINQINLKTKQVLTQLEKTYKAGKYSTGYGEAVYEMVLDLHNAATGVNQLKNKTASNIMRTILAAEFITKIGLNPRSAVRNFTQTLLNNVQFEQKHIKEMNDFFEGSDQKIFDVEKDMLDAGILFSEVKELQESIGRNPSIYTTVEYNRTSGKLEHVPISISERILNAVSRVAQKSGFMMAKVENANRKRTYKIGYSQMYNSLDNGSFAEMVKKQYRASHNNQDPKSGYDKIITAKKRQMAKDYAINMTVALHFDYNTFSKAKIMRDGPGSIIFQFQQYAFKLFERTAEYARAAKNDVIAGETVGEKFNTANSWRIYKMAIAYYLAPHLAAQFTGIDFSNMVQHDTMERVQQLATGIWGTEEEKKKAFHGKGPIMGNLGFPVMSDIVNIGHMYELINMDEESIFTHLAGLQDNYDIRGDRSIGTHIRLLNGFIGRTAFRHIPNFRKGNIGWAIAQDELGLYKTKKSKQQQKDFEDRFPKLNKILDSLEDI